MSMSPHQTAALSHNINMANRSLKCSEVEIFDNDTNRSQA
jgi:hypothetical protein